MHRGTARALFELLSSMRFAISLLTILSIASVVGMVVRQHEPFNAYLSQFGLYSVYNAGWFLVILAFLVLSTTLCIGRQAAPMLREMRSFRERAREASLRSFAHRASLVPAVPHADAVARAAAYLAHTGFASRVADNGDGNLPLRLQVWLGDKHITVANQLIVDIPGSARLGVNNPRFRGDVFIPEGRMSSFAVLGLGDDILLQELPFTITLDKFHIDHYDNGMPKRFASDIRVTDRRSGETTAHTIEVNKPLTVDGITLYQSSFEDGGSLLAIKARSLLPGRPGVLHELQCRVGETTEFADARAGFRYTLEFTDFKAFNVEDMGTGEAPADATRTMERLQQHLGSGAKAPARREMRNLGPSFTFKLRDAAGQAREFHNYMLPIEQDGRWFLYAGLRETQADAFRYMRIPLDGGGRVETWFAIRDRLLDPAQRNALVERFAARSFPTEAGQDAMRAALIQSARQTLGLFSEKGYESLGGFIEQSVPEAERSAAADVLIRILQGVASEAWMMAREVDGEPALALNPARATYLNDTIAAISDSQFYGAPAWLQLDAFEERHATVLQATRSPGMSLVYLGALALVLGVFAMLYIRKRRLFVLVKADEALVAMSSNRKALDVDAAFRHHVGGLAAVLGAPVPASSTQEGA